MGETHYSVAIRVNLRLHVESWTLSKQAETASFKVVIWSASIHKSFLSKLHTQMFDELAGNLNKLQ